MKKILIINGPNLNLLGERQPSIYGDTPFDTYINQLENGSFKITTFQSNIEGEIIDQLHKAEVDGIILNAGGYTHTSVAIRDAVAAIETPVVEVHISNIADRESFRHTSLISPVAVGCIFGFGLYGYQLALNYFKIPRD
ncbi:type II 3-dehydroquinate dehydratase [Brumimicrobium salinarum]|uniref:3-dehydroquinate dehydratase n=1 Tax=Brumimicrobium salinarum TaxID=2058658 RepID=A0A2I0QZ87_9FLAO|nr:type II 3-dehydroquinate dehydratase [Brumimicrobium salinarum]PKR79645.1 type II 3-dehydroquinate dehydratase [Brumimicrobium salinarum]